METTTYPALAHEVFETLRIKVIIYPQVTSKGEVLWEGIASLLPAQMILVHASGKASKAEARASLVEHLSILGQRILDMRNTLET